MLDEMLEPGWGWRWGSTWAGLAAGVRVDLRRGLGMCMDSAVVVLEPGMRPGLRWDWLGLRWGLIRGWPGTGA